jgi:hypothetical protein
VFSQLDINRWKAAYHISPFGYSSTSTFFVHPHYLSVPSSRHYWHPIHPPIHAPLLSSVYHNCICLLVLSISPASTNCLLQPNYPQCLTGCTLLPCLLSESLTTIDHHASASHSRSRTRWRRWKKWMIDWSTSAASWPSVSRPETGKQGSRTGMLHSACESTSLKHD